ncbi:uncharacterized protein [Ptychodera flava]|uniref:uncharacterized protein n=1 Tax=Ptychodera flava TaxID=63121 RepID=UPI00396A9674
MFPSYHGISVFHLLCRDEDGIYRGFHADLITAVCREAGKKCVNQVVPKSACLTHRSGEIPHAGPALLGKQIDICLGWSKTSARTLSVDYTEPFVRFDSEVLFVVKSGNPNNFDPNDIRGKTIDRCLSHVHRKNPTTS